MNQRYIELLGNKLEIVTNMLNITKEANFTCDSSLIEDEAEAFFVLYNRRENLVFRMKAIDKKLADIELAGKADKLDNKADDTCAAIIKEIVNIAAEIVELDKKNTVVSAKLSNVLKSNIKQVRDKMAINNVYVDVYESASNTGYYYDSKK